MEYEREDRDLLIRIDERTKSSAVQINDLQRTMGDLSKVFVTRKEFAPVRVVVYGAVGIILTAVFSGIVYLHGWIERPEPLVLTDEDFGRAYLTEGWAREFLQRLFAEFTTLFVGYSHSDVTTTYLARGLNQSEIKPR